MVGTTFGLELSHTFGFIKWSNTAVVANSLSHFDYSLSNFSGECCPDDERQAELEEIRLRKRRLVDQYEEWLESAVGALIELERKRLAILQGWTDEDLCEQRVSCVVE